MEDEPNPTTATSKQDEGNDDGAIAESKVSQDLGSEDEGEKQHTEYHEEKGVRSETVKHGGCNDGDGGGGASRGEGEGGVAAESKNTDLLVHDDDKLAHSNVNVELSGGEYNEERQQVDSSLVPRDIGSKEIQQKQNHTLAEPDYQQQRDSAGSATTTAAAATSPAVEPQQGSLSQTGGGERSAPDPTPAPPEWPPYCDPTYRMPEEINVAVALDSGEVGCCF